jgi:hypothetical protein
MDETYPTPHRFGDLYSAALAHPGGMLAPVDAGMFRDIIHVARACSGPGRPLERSLVLACPPARRVTSWRSSSGSIS